MKPYGNKLGRLEAQFFAYTQFKRKQMVRCGEIARALEITPKQELELLSRMARRRWITRIRRGYYAVPERLPPGGNWSPGEYGALALLMEDRKARYQISGPRAFNFYGFDDQMPNWIVVYNDRISGERKIGKLRYIFIKIPIFRLGDVHSFRAGDGTPAIYSSKARTLIDAICDWSRFNGIPRAFRWIRNAVAQDPKMTRQLVKAALKYGNQGTLRRLGFVLSRLNVKKELLTQLRQAIRPSKSLIPLVPTAPVRGKIDSVWGIIINES